MTVGIYNSEELQAILAEYPALKGQVVTLLGQVAEMQAQVAAMQAELAVAQAALAEALPYKQMMEEPGMMAAYEAAVAARSGT